MSVTLAFSGAELAGFSCFLFDQETEFGTYLHNLYINPDHQRKGVALGLLTASLRKFSLRQRTKAVHLLTLADNYAARRFYEGLNGRLIEEKRNVMARYPEVAYVRYQWRSAQELDDITSNISHKS
ncbi:GNAT family N-acetyltransferase [Agrobacterium cavarae]|uniref:GNAT family N-acetyltransferase n=1 Tax=Agrobacterium cavarae TaxID=2528239 RepID=UPI0028995CB5|nr:GNAT family N-acetyltransferase [Agrobacterium cavarae]